MLALPVLLYVVFGAPRAADPMPSGTIGAFMMVSFSILERGLIELPGRD